MTIESLMFGDHIFHFVVVKNGSGRLIELNNLNVTVPLLFLRKYRSQGCSVLYELFGICKNDLNIETIAKIRADFYFIYSEIKMN